MYFDLILLQCCVVMYWCVTGGPHQLDAAENDAQTCCSTTRL